jgi:hypothetical protein
MKKYFALPLLLAAVNLVGFLPVNNWVKYTSAVGHFSITFPGKPEESVQDDKNADGTPVKIHFATYAPNENEVYIVGWTDIASSFPKRADLKLLLAQSKDAATTSMKAKKVTTLSTNTGKQPYIEFTFSGEGFTGKERIYIVNKVQYSVITMFSVKTGVQPTANQFITSFKAS